MKTRLNILCFFIFAAIIGSVVHTVGEGLHDFLWGMSSANEHKDVDDTVFLSLKPTTIGAYTDSVFNSTTNEWMPIQYREIVINPKNNTLSPGGQALVMIISLLVIFFAIFQIVIFCRLIYAINKSIIFEWSNVRKLRLIGWAMIISFLMHALFIYIYYAASINAVSIPDYSIVSDNMWNFSLLIPGLGVLLMAEIFAVGLRLREEQELTI